jgi:hypothetical protein
MIKLFALYQRKEKIWSGSCCEHMCASRGAHNVKHKFVLLLYQASGLNTSILSKNLHQLIKCLMNRNNLSSKFSQEKR